VVYGSFFVFAAVAVAAAGALWRDFIALFEVLALVKEAIYCFPEATECSPCSLQTFSPSAPVTHATVLILCEIWQTLNSLFRKG
jgi:hypothetical protein